MKIGIKLRRKDIQGFWIFVGLVAFAALILSANQGWIK